MLAHPNYDLCTFHLYSPSIYPCVCGSLFLLARGDRDQLFGSLGNIVGALDDLLSEELIIHCRSPRLWGRCLTALHLQPRGTGSQQAERAVDCIQCWALWRNEGWSKLSSHVAWQRMQTEKITEQSGHISCPADFTTASCMLSKATDLAIFS